MAFGGKHGSQLITADGVVGVSGQPVMVYGVHIISGAGGAGVVLLRRGTAVTDTIATQQEGTAASKGTSLNYGDGFYFPGGCYVDVDANVTSVLVSYDQY